MGAYEKVRSDGWMCVHMILADKKGSIIWPASQVIATDWLSQIRQKWNKRERMYIVCTKLRRSAEREIVDSQPTHHVGKLKKPEMSDEG